MRRLGAALADALSGGEDIDLRDALAEAISTVTRQHRRTCPESGQRPQPALGPSATVVITRWRQTTLDYLVLGDSSLVVQTDHGMEHHSDQRLAGIGAAVRANLRAWLQAGGGYEHPNHQELMRALVAAQREVRNIPEGYWIAADDPAAAYHSHTGSYPLGAVRRLALLSDGLGRAVSPLKLHGSWEELLAALCHDGPAAVIQAVRSAEDADPNGQQVPRSSRSDDASVAVVEFLSL